MHILQTHLTAVHKYGRHPHVGRKDYVRLYGKYLKWIPVNGSEPAISDPSEPSSPEKTKDEDEEMEEEQEDFEEEEESEEVEEEEDDEYDSPPRKRNNRNTKRRAPPSRITQRLPTRAERMRIREMQQDPTQAVTYSSKRRQSAVALLQKEQTPALSYSSKRRQSINAPTLQQEQTHSPKRRQSVINAPLPSSDDPPCSDMVIEKILIQRIKSLLDRRFGPSSR
jgi:hypothetical protein